MPENHRFPMEKYALLHEQLLWEGVAEVEDFFAPAKVSIADASLAHDRGYVEAFVGLHLPERTRIRIGFVQSPQLVARELTLVQGTIDGAHYALEEGVAFNIAGGTHHAYSDRGEGFCMLNDQAVAAAYLLKTGRAKRILIVDLDVHQGNGTAEIFAHREEVFTFSMHAKGNYPFVKEQSDNDIELPKGVTDKEYLSLLKATLPALFERHRPDFVFYQSGVDVLESDRFGLLSLTLEGCAQRDRFVFEECQKRGIPVQCSMGGGYSPKLSIILEAHTNTFREAQRIFC
ncbi:histone deacetylase family protein [Capnocytophaga gingivalis]|uniref:histone deacetylase family protein n=1 Tax=Capnocytophaga gingivalis TaxID=1017 RepID=UPI003742F19A